MAVRYSTTTDFPRLTRERVAEDEGRISGSEEQNLGPFRGFAFAILLEAALALLGGVGWQLWRMIR
jgi:hypothetical protein